MKIAGHLSKKGGGDHLKFESSVLVNKKITRDTTQQFFLSNYINLGNLRILAKSKIKRENFSISRKKVNKIISPII